MNDPDILLATTEGVMLSRHRAKALDGFTAEITRLAERYRAGGGTWRDFTDGTQRALGIITADSWLED